MFIFMSRVCFFLFIMKTNARATTAAVRGSDCGDAGAAGWRSALGVLPDVAPRVLVARPPEPRRQLLAQRHLLPVILRVGADHVRRAYAVPPTSSLRASTRRSIVLE